MRFTLALVRVIAASLSLAAAAGAVVDPAAPAPREIPLGAAAGERAHERDVFRLGTRATAHARAALERRLETRLGGTWRIPAWNPRTDTPHYVLGSGVETGVRPATDEVAEALARRHIARHPEVFHAPVPERLHLDAVRRGRGKVAVHFRQQVDGVAVLGARAHLTFTDTGRLFVMGSDLFAEIDVETTPTLSPESAADLAVAALGPGANVTGIDGTAELYVLPVPESETRVTHHLVWRVRVRTERPAGIWVTHVDAHTSEVHWRYDDVHHATVGGTVTADVQPGSYCAGMETSPGAYVRVRVADLADVVTDAEGRWEYASVLPVRGAVAMLSGPWAEVRNRSGLDAIGIAVGDLGNSLDIHFDDDNSRRDERDAFAAINTAHDFFETFHPGFPFTNQRIVVNVAQEGTCQAYWNGQIWCFRAGDGCAATGEIQSVVLHELGHGLQTAVIGGQGEQGLGEGNADILANLITGDSVIGRGFFADQCDIGVRDSDNTLQYPEDVVGAPGAHAAGRVIAGFHWDVLEALQAELGDETGTREAASLWHYGRFLERPWTQPAQVIATFIADDDDGNLFNGTPRCSALNAAALAHGFGTFNCEILVWHQPLETRTAPGSAQALAWLSSPEGDIVYAGLRYRINRSYYQTVEMIDTLGVGVYTASIPELKMNDTVQYYLFAVDDQQAYVDSPYGAAVTGARHTFDVAAAWFDMETPADWHADADGTDTAATGRWERVAPRATSVQPGADHTPSGTHCWVTGQQPEGSDNNGANDVDHGVTRLYTPWLDLTNATLAKIKYWRFFSNDAGLDPSADPFTAEVRNNSGGWETLEATTESSNEWVQVEYDLEAFFGDALGVVQLRFSVSDDDVPSIVEAAIDDFAVLTDVGDPTLAPPPVDVEPAAAVAVAASYFAAPRPNPFNPTTRLLYGVSSAGPVHLRIFDVTGRLVRTLVDETLAAGHYAVTWDATTDAGRPLASGVYYAKLRAGTADLVRRLTLTK